MLTFESYDTNVEHVITKKLSAKKQDDACFAALKVLFLFPGPVAEKNTTNARLLIPLPWEGFGTGRILDISHAF